MKKFIFILFAFLSVKGYSQLSLAYSGQIGTFSSPSLTKTNDGGYIGFKTTSADTKGKSWNTFRKSISFVKYDKDFKQVNEARLTASGGICNGQYYELKSAGNKFWFIYLEPMEDNSVGNIKAVELDPVSLQQKEAKTLAASTSINHTLRDYRYTMYLDFLCAASPAGKYMYLCVQLSEDDSYLACFDENMKQVWGGKNKRAEGKICSVEVNDAGYLYIGIKPEKGNLSCSIFSPSGQVSSAELNLAAGKVRDIIFHPVKGSEQVVVTGSYMEDDNCTGVYKSVMGRKVEITNAVTTVFPKNIVESMKKEGFASTKAKKFGVDASYCAAAVRNSEGNSNMGMIMEFSREAGGGATGVSTNLLGGSLIYVDFANAAPVFTRVPKYSVGSIPQHYAYNGHYFNGCMYYASPADSKLIVLYYDNPDNLTRDPELDAKVVNPKNQELVAAVINKDGTFKRQVVRVNMLSASGMPPVTGAVLLLPVYIGNNNAIVTVKL
jgi:hypothetical protein